MGVGKPIKTPCSGREVARQVYWILRCSLPAPTHPSFMLGNPIVNRTQLLRTVEEMAMIDVISRGRMECGFVRAVPYKAAPANVHPLRGAERLWEAHDMILRLDDARWPFNFEGRWFHAGQIYIWPRPYQQPHPPGWLTVRSGKSTVPAAKAFTSIYDYKHMHDLRRQLPDEEGADLRVFGLEFVR